MKRSVFAPVLLGFAALVLGACATSGGATAGAKAPADQILGKWTCTAAPEGMPTEAVIDYIKGGKATAGVKLGVEQSGMKVAIEATGDATWAFLANGKLEETITALNVTKATMNGNNVPPAMIQGMVQQSVVGQKTTSTVVFSDAGYVSTDDESGVVTTCRR